MQLEAVHQNIVGQFQSIEQEGLEDGDKTMLADVFGKYQAMAAEMQAAFAQLTAKTTAAKATSAAATSSAQPPVAQFAPPAPKKELTDPALHAACPAEVAPKSWAQTVAPPAGTGAPATPQKPSKASAGTGSATKQDQASTIDRILGLDLAAAGHERAKENGKQNTANKRSRATKESDDAATMSDGEESEQDPTC